MPGHAINDAALDAHTVLSHSAHIESLTAVSDENTALPQAAPGEAGKPRVTVSCCFHSLRSKSGASNCDSASGSMSSTASFGVTSFSFTKSVAITTAA